MNAPHSSRISAAHVRTQRALAESGHMRAAAWRIGTQRHWRPVACGEHDCTEECSACRSVTTDQWLATLCHALSGTHRMRYGLDMHLIVVELLGYDPARVDVWARFRAPALRARRSKRKATEAA